MGVFEQFPYTNFHDMNLDWLLSEMKKLIDDWVQLRQEFASLEEEWEAMKQFITDYFDNLDVSSEIRAIINRMVNDGSLLALIAPTIASTTAGEASTWLAAHITNPSSPPIDKSLTVANAAADAQMAGDAGLSNAYRVTLQQENIDFDTFPCYFHQSVSTSDGSLIASQTRLTTRYILHFDHDIVLNLATILQDNSWLAIYNSAGVFQSWRYIRTDNRIEAGTYFRPILARNDNLSMSIDEGASATFQSLIGNEALINSVRIGAGEHGIDRAILDAKGLYNIVRGTVNSSGVVYSATRYTTREKITFDHDMIVTCADPAYKNATWIAYYPNGGTGYESYKYIENGAFIPADTEVRIVFGRSDSAVFPIETCAGLLYEQLGIYDIPGEIKIASFNVGKWYDGVQDGCPDDHIAAQRKRWYELIGKNDPDIMLLTEATEYFNRSQTLGAYGYIMAHAYPYMYNVTTWGGLRSQARILSKYPLADVHMISFTSGSGRPFLVAKAKMRNRLVNIAIVHYGPEADASLRAQDIEQTVQWAADNPGCIIGGDFNLYSMAELAPFTNAGMQLSNGGIFGTFATWPHGTSTWPNEAIDNIVTDMNIMYVYAGDPADASAPYPLSDHVPLYATIRTTL